MIFIKDRIVRIVNLVDTNNNVIENDLKHIKLGDKTVHRRPLITFDANGGTGGVAPTYYTWGTDTIYEPSPEPTRSGYVFQGWYLGTELQTFPQGAPNISSQTYLAKWQAQTAAPTVDNPTCSEIGGVQTVSVRIVNNDSEEVQVYVNNVGIGKTLISGESYIHTIASGSLTPYDYDINVYAKAPQKVDSINVNKSGTITFCPILN